MTAEEYAAIVAESNAWFTAYHRAFMESIGRGDNRGITSATKISDMDTLVTTNDSESGTKDSKSMEVSRA